MSAAKVAAVGHHNGRGPAWQRRRRKQWLIDTYGDGQSVRCACDGCPRCKPGSPDGGCAEVLTIDTVTVDRIVPGIEGGTYRRDNIRPTSLGCNTSSGARIAWTRQGTPDDYVPVAGADDLAEPGCLNDRVSA